HNPPMSSNPGKALNHAPFRRRSEHCPQAGRYEGVPTCPSLWKQTPGVSSACRIGRYLRRVAGYRDLLRTPGVGRIMAAQLTARSPTGMTSLATLLHVGQSTGSYGAAGRVLAATSVGQAVSGPVTSRWMGVWGIRRVL